MTLKEAIKKAHKERKKTSIKKKDNRFWAVRIEVEVVESVHIVEYVKASSSEEAQTIALKQFDRRTPELVHDRASRVWKDKNRHSLQHLRVAETKKRKKFVISEKQREILQGLIIGKYLERIYSRWYLVDPSSKSSVRSMHYRHHIPSVSVDALFQKGLLIDLATANMNDKEIEIQSALGSLPELKAYIIDMARVKTLGLRL